MIKHLLLLITLIQFNKFSLAQSSNDSLIAEAVKTDNIFWNAYNNCDIEKMKQLTAPDVEFYHDKGGITLGDSALSASIKNNLCSDQKKFKIRREIVANTNKPYPMMKDGQVYGVLMAGKHMFYTSENGKKEKASGIAQYADLWLLKNGEWKMGRVFSYDHQGISINKDKPVAQVSAATLKEYAGKYQGQKMGPLTVQNAKGYLIITSGNLTQDIYPSSPTLFFAKERDLTFQFAKKGAGIMDVIVRENGEVVETYSAKKR